MDTPPWSYAHEIPRLYRISQRVHCLTNPSLRCHRATELRWSRVTSAPGLGTGMSRTVFEPSLVYER